MSGRIKRTFANPITEADRALLNTITDIVEQIDKKEKPSKDLKTIRDYICARYSQYYMHFGTTDPTPYENKFCFVAKYIHRGVAVDVYMDDCGQQYYFYYKHQAYSCGAYCDFEPVVKYIIDNDLDTICSYVDHNPKFAGAYCRFANKAHTKVNITYRNEVVKTYKVDKDDPSSVTKIRKDGEEFLERFLKEKHD